MALRDSQTYAGSRLKIKYTWRHKIGFISQISRRISIFLHENTSNCWPRSYGKFSDTKLTKNAKNYDTYVLTVHCEFQRVRITGVPLARWHILGVTRCCSSAWRSHVTYLTFGSNCGPQLWRSCDICLAECGVYSSKHPAFCRSPAVTYFTLVADVTGYKSFAAYMERLALM